MRFRPTEQALVKPLDDGVLAINIDSGYYYYLNITAARMWALMERGYTMVEIVATIVAEFAVTATEVERDLTNLIQDLKRKGLVEDA